MLFAVLTGARGLGPADADAVAVVRRKVGRESGILGRRSRRFGEDTVISLVAIAILPLAFARTLPENGVGKALARDDHVPFLAVLSKGCAYDRGLTGDGEDGGDSGRSRLHGVPS